MQKEPEDPKEREKRKAKEQKERKEREKRKAEEREKLRQHNAARFSEVQMRSVEAALAGERDPIQL